VKQIDYRQGKFFIHLPFSYNHIIRGMPSRKFNKRSNCWVAPAVGRNVKYIKTNFNIDYLTPTANKFIATFEEMKVSNESFPAWYRFKNEPMAHQMDALNKAWGNDQFAFLFEQGLGKTFTAINWATALRIENKIDSVVVICPSSIKLVWEYELDEHCPIPTEKFVMSAGGNKGAEKFMFDKDKEFPWLIMGVEALSQGSAKDVLNKFVQTRNCALIVDESSRIKTPGKKRTERVVAAGREAKYRAILSGTPVTQGVQDLFAQFQFLNEQILGFDNYYSFRNHFCVMGGFEQRQIVGYVNMPELIELIEPYSMRVIKKDALDLPDKVYEQRFITMSSEQARIYKELKKEMVAEIKDSDKRIEVESVLEQMMRLQQITGGHYSLLEDTQFKEDERIIKKYSTHRIDGTNAKLNELMQVMDDTFGSYENRDAKCIVWARFVPEIALIKETLLEAGWTVVTVQQFQNGGAQVFLATQQAAGMGLTLTAAETVIYYSNTFSLEHRLQSEDRCHRKGTVNKVTYVDLICDSTVDARVHDVLAGKYTIADLVSEGIRNGAVEELF
jgi:SNF2 family DNA or RNA helicase